MSDQTFRFVLSMDGIQGPAQAFRQTAQAMQQTAQAAQQVSRAYKSPLRGTNLDPANMTRDIRDTGRMHGPSPSLIAGIQNREAREQARREREERRGLRAAQQEVFAEIRQMQRIEREQRARQHMSAVQAIRAEDRERREEDRVRRQAEQEARRNQIVGPHSRIRQAQDMLARAQTPEETADAQLILARRQFALLRAQRRGAGGGGILGQIGQAAMSARVGIGPGGLSIMPIVGRVFDIIRTASPVLGAWLVGITAVAAATIEAAKNIRIMAAAAAESGGTFGQATMLSRLGLPAGQIAGAAAGLRGRLSSDPYAMMAGARLGIGPQPPPQFGSQNYAKTLIDALSALRQVRDAEEQLRLARMLGIESMIDLARVSNDVWQGIRIDAATAQRAITPQDQQGARDLTTGIGRLGGNLMTLLETITAPLVKLLAPAVNALATVIDVVTEAFRLLLLPVNAAIDGILALARWLDEHFGTHLGGIGDNTDALRENTRVMREGYFGGGARARGALPSGMGGMALQKALEGGALRYGAWQLGAG